MGIEEGLGDSISSLDFVIKKIEGDQILTDLHEGPIDKDRYGYFDYKVGQRYVIDVWENGSFVICTETGEANFIPEDGTSVRVEGDLNEYIKKIQSTSKQNKFERLYREGKLKAGVRTRIYNTNWAVLEVALAEDSDWRHLHLEPMRPFKAYIVHVNLDNNDAQIFEAEYIGGPIGFTKKKDMSYKSDRSVKLPSEIIETAQPQDLVSSHKFKILNTDSMKFLKDNCMN